MSDALFVTQIALMLLNQMSTIPVSHRVLQCVIDMVAIAGRTPDLGRFILGRKKTLVYQVESKILQLIFGIESESTFWTDQDIYFGRLLPICFALFAIRVVELKVALDHVDRSQHWASARELQLFALEIVEQACHHIELFGVWKHQIGPLKKVGKLLFQNFVVVILMLLVGCFVTVGAIWWIVDWYETSWCVGRRCRCTRLILLSFDEMLLQLF